MLDDDSPIRATTAGPIKAMAFRDDHSAQPITITELGFDQCRISSTDKFAVGERLRLHLHGQGLIEAEVRSSAGDEIALVFLTTARC